MPKPTTVEIVASRRKGITGYASVGRGTLLGNPYKALATNGHYTQSRVVELFRELFLSSPVRQDAALELLARDWPEGVVRIACPCNGALRGEPCHASVIKEFLEAEITKEASL